MIKSSILRLSTKEEVEQLSVGDTVVTDFHRGDGHVKRKITRIEKDPKCSSSGYRISADDGGTCPCCKRSLSRPIAGGVDGAWFIKVEPDKPEGLIGVVTWQDCEHCRFYYKDKDGEKCSQGDNVMSPDVCAEFRKDGTFRCKAFQAKEG
jgi:hypothetical protein